MPGQPDQGTMSGTTKVAEAERTTPGVQSCNFGPVFPGVDIPI